MRLATIARDAEQRSTERTQLEKDLRTARSKMGVQSHSAEVELLSLRLQLLQAEMPTLQAESTWLSKRRSLHDALMSVTQTRRASLQQALDTIKHALGTTIRQEQAALQSTEAHLEQKLQQTAAPTEAMRLAVVLETVDIQKLTADYRQQLNRLGDTLLAQEQRSTQLQQDMDRLRSLVEKYASGEGVAQRLLTAFERIQHEQQRDYDAPIKTLEARLGLLATRMLALDDQLYEFDRHAATRLAELETALQALTPEQRHADMTTVRQALDERKAALRDQQQVLTELTQGVTKLLTLHRDYLQLLEESYYFIRTKMFSLRNAEAFSWAVWHDMVLGSIATVRRVQAFVYAEQVRLQASLTSAPYLWGFALVLSLGLPWVAARLHRRLRRLVTSALATSAQREVPPGVGVVCLLLCKSAIWPAYLVLLAWSRAQFLTESTADTELLHAFVSGLQVSALVVWIGLVGRAMLQQDGWGQRFWGLSVELCRFLQRVVTAGCLAALILLVPYHSLLTAPGEGGTAVHSLALARSLFLAFQGVVLLLVGLVGRRHSPLMAMVLARSQQTQGLLWRLWPLIYVVLLAGVVTPMTLHLLGYFYAARYIWSRVLESLVVILVLPLLLGVLVSRGLHRLQGSVKRLHHRMPQYRPEDQVVDRSFAIARMLWNTLLALLTLSVILAIWGVSVTWLLTSPLTLQALWRALVIAVAVGCVAGVIQVSNALTAYLLRPRTTRQGDQREAGRKLRTLAPLVQTIIRAAVIFIAVLVILEQLGIATGPILAGVGIFGLAVGFASQSLIKDIINGLFILFEDSLSVGDVVVLRGTGGQVEKVTLRAVTIRDLSGSVHIIPNSTIDMVTNMTKDYSCYVLDVSVAYREDIDTVTAILREIDEDMRRDPAYSRDMLEPLEVFGLERFADSAMIIQARLKTRPIQQWRIGREFKRRLKKVFDERGIEIPFPHRIIYWGSPPHSAQSPLPEPVGEHSPPQ